MAELFRKSSLEKLSSPEQLDKMIVITPPSFWLALVGGGVIVAGALAWAILGRLPVNVETQGIYVNNGGVYSVYCETSGVVERLAVHKGDEIGEGDVIAYLNTDDLEQKLENYEARIADIEAVTMDSQDDVVTADNKSLIEIKGQMTTLDQNLYQDQQLLEMYSEDVAAQRQATDEAERNLQEAATAYYNSLNTGDSTGEQLAYAEAQSDLANASAYLQEAYAGLDQANVAYSQAKGQYRNIEEQYDKLAAQERALQKVADDAWAAFAAECQAAGISPDRNNPEDYRKEVQDLSNDDLQTAMETYETAQTAYKSCVEAGRETKEQLASSMEQYEVEMDAARETRDNYQDDVNNYAGQKESAAAAYEGARDSYLERIAALGAAQTRQTQLSNDYSRALNTYSTEQTKLDNLLDSLARAEVQVDSDKRVVDEQTETIYSQFAATKAAAIDQLAMESEQYREQLDKCEVTSTVSGRVTDITVVQGSAVNQGSELLKVQQDEEEDVVVCYVPLNAGKKIAEGMEVLVCPTTVNRQEYGHMSGTVLHVDPYVTSTEDLRTMLGNDSLVEAFLQNGPVVAVVCRLRKDASTSSGYYWSSAKGKDVALAEGTMMEASIVLEEKAPITMVIPYIKEKLTIEIEDNQQG